MGDIEHVADPDHTGDMNYGLLIALASVTTDTERALGRMRICLKLMHTLEISYEDVFPSKSTFTVDEIVEKFESLGVPLVHPGTHLSSIPFTTSIQT